MKVVTIPGRATKERGSLGKRRGMKMSSKNSKVLTGAEKRKPPAAGIGRKKGVPNKLTKALKDMILGALDQAGGQEYLARQAEENPAAFMTLVGKVLPVTLNGDKNAPISIEIVRRIVDGKAAGN